MLPDSDSDEVRMEVLKEYLPLFQQAQKDTPDMWPLLSFNWEKMQRAPTAARIREIGEFALNSAKVQIAGTIIAAG